MITNKAFNTSPMPEGTLWKRPRWLSFLVGILLAITTLQATADPFRMTYRIAGLLAYETPQLPWELAVGDLPRATYNSPYRYDFGSLLSSPGEGDIHWQAEGRPAWSTLNSATGEFSGTPSVSDKGITSFTLSASHPAHEQPLSALYSLVVGGNALPASAISAGYFFSCAVTTGGAVKCWGRNQEGQLGNGTTINSKTPTQVIGLASGAVDVKVYRAHACALLDNGGAKCWGANGYGQLGDGTFTSRLEAVQVTGLPGPLNELSVGEQHSCGITIDGAALCWGRNGHGRLGDGTLTNRSIPGAVIGMETEVTSISAGMSHTCATLTSGHVYCWGRNANYRFGVIGTQSYLTPMRVPSINGTARRISTGKGYHTCIATMTGEAHCWGFNNNYQIGRGNTSSSYTPINVQGLGSKALDIALGYDISCALKEGNNTKCWGNGTKGQFGNNTTKSGKTAVSPLGTSGRITAISPGWMHSCGIIDGLAHCWGNNDNSELGDGTAVTRLVPNEVVNPAQ